MKHPATIFAVPVALILLIDSQPRADTVYLKNGSWVHGIVRVKSDDTIRLDIGELGHLEVPVEQIVEVEKNDRTGSGYAISDEWSDFGVSSGDQEPAPRSDAASGKETGRDDAFRTQANSRAPQRDDSETDSGSASEGSGESQAPSLPRAKVREIQKHIYNLQRQQSRYRVRAERHLKEIGAPAIPFLLPLATHTHDLVRIAVFRIFEAVADERAIDACIEALTDENKYVRDYAERTLRRLTGQHFGYVRSAQPATLERIRKRWRKWWETAQEEERDPVRDEAVPPPPSAP